MDFNLVTNIETCSQYINNTVPLNMVYYSHIPTAVVSLLVGFFVFIKNRNNLSGKLLFYISIVFSIWTFSDLILWTSYDSRMYMFFWVCTALSEILLFLVSLYFVYVFIKKRSISLKFKLIFALLIAPVLALVNTKYYVTFFSISDCIPINGPLWKNYILPFDLMVIFYITIFSITKYVKAEKDFKKQILLVTIGIDLFLIIFILMGFISDYLIEHNVTDATSAYGYELYGLFGMPIFLGFLVYLIVQYKAFDIKILSVQALVVALVILIGSQFAFIQNPINMVLTGITLAIAVGFGWTLIRSVKMEVQRKEELQIMTNRLAQANDQLRKLDNAKSEFISIASHQLRTPLTAIKGFISLLLEGSYGKINSMLKDVLNKIYISNERLIDLVEDMLNLSRIESGRMEYDIKKVNMEEVLKEICDTFSIRSKEKGLKLELKLPENPLPEVTTDRNKIREVISNLVDNAIKYTLKGWVTVKLSQNEDKVRIAVIDTGIGVPKEEMPYLFEKFSRGKDINRLNTGGTGLGLHVGKKMIESLSGKLWVESEGAGKGSTFIVELPVEIKEAK